MWCILKNQLSQTLLSQRARSLKAQEEADTISCEPDQGHFREITLSGYQQNIQYLPPVWGCLGYCSTDQYFICILSVFLQTILATESFKNLLEVFSFVYNNSWKIKFFSLHIMQAATMPFDAWATAAEHGLTAAISWASHWERNTKGTKMVHALPFRKRRQQKEQQSCQPHPPKNVTEGTMKAHVHPQLPAPGVHSCYHLSQLFSFPLILGDQ